jgi:hypothetical protein
MAAKPDTKKIVFYDTLPRQAEFKIQLAHDGIGQSEFYRAILTGYIKKDPDILAFVDKIKASKKAGKPAKKSDITRSKKLIKKGNETANKLGLAKDEIENIFDILEQANPDL